MKTRLTIWFLATLVFVIPFAAFGVYLFYEKEFERLPIYGNAKIVNDRKVSHTIPEFQLVNQDAESITNNHWNRKIVVADFFFSHCPIVCPKMTSSLKRVQQEFQNDQIVINSFSVDPERD